MTGLSEDATLVSAMFLFTFHFVRCVGMNMLP